MKQLGRITAIYDHGQITAEQDHTVLSMDRIIEAEDDNTVEFHAVITNLSDQEIFLEKVCLFEAESLDSFDIGSEPYTVFHSGRHKNDMPGVFVTGRRDACMEDVSSVMAETGTGLNTAETAAVVSDHLTMIQGSNGKTLSVAFLTGRDQLFETRILLDETGEFAGIVSSVIFRVYIKPGQSAVTETLRIARVNDADAEVQSFAERKAELYGARNTRHPAVFCTWYYYGLTVSLEDVYTCLNILHQRKLPYDVFQVDEGWEDTLGEYRPNARFPMNDTTYYVFDITNPETLNYFRDLYHRFTDEWGYVYHKLDFTRAAVIYEDADFSDRSITLAQAYYRAVRAIREGMGEDSFFLMCGVSKIRSSVLWMRSAPVPMCFPCGVPM